MNRMTRRGCNSASGYALRSVAAAARGWQSTLKNPVFCLDKPYHLKVITDTNTPLTNVITIAAGGKHSLAVASNGCLWAWGDNSNGQLGNDDRGNDTNKAEVVMTTVYAVAAGYLHSLALSDAPYGDLYVWGDNSSGQLGDGNSPNDRNFQWKIGTGYSYITCGSRHSLAVKNEIVYTWGENEKGQLGTNSTTDRDTPGETGGQGAGNAVFVAAGLEHSFSIDTSGNPRGWGNNPFFQVYDSRDNEEPGTDIIDIPIRVGSHLVYDMKKIAAGHYHNLFIKTNDTDEYGKVWAWGRNEYGELGDGTTTYTVEDGGPTQVLNLTNVVDIAAGDSCSFALVGGAPVAIIDPNPLQVYGKNVSLTATDRSYDPDKGNIVAIEWECTAEATEIGTTNDAYYEGVIDESNGWEPCEFTLRLQDDQGQWGTTSVDWLPGDINLDNAVNLTDFVILRNNFGKSYKPANIDGVYSEIYGETVNLSDFVILRNNFGKSGNN